jgi:hypothetical protein
LVPNIRLPASLYRRSSTLRKLASPLDSRTCVVTGLVAWFGSTWRGGMWMTADPGDNCEPGSGVMAAAANQVKPMSRMK